jgi:hypothetical protein
MDFCVSLLNMALATIKPVAMFDCICIKIANVCVLQLWNDILRTLQESEVKVVACGPMMAKPILNYLLA